MILPQHHKFTVHFLRMLASLFTHESQSNISVKSLVWARYDEGKSKKSKTNKIYIGRNSGKYELMNILLLLTSHLALFCCTTKELEGRTKNFGHCVVSLYLERKLHIFNSEILFNQFFVRKMFLFETAETILWSRANFLFM